MKIRYVMSGSEVFSTDSDCVPAVGCTVIITTDSYKKGVPAGSLITFPVTAEHPPIFDYSGRVPEVSIDVNQWVVLKRGPEPEEAE